MWSTFLTNLRSAAEISIGLALPLGHCKPWSLTNSSLRYSYSYVSIYKKILLVQILCFKGAHRTIYLEECYAHISNVTTSHERTIISTRIPCLKLFWSFISNKLKRRPPFFCMKNAHGEMVSYPFLMILWSHDATLQLSFFL